MVKSMTATDESLLQAFASHRDETAFRALADRYLGLVFHTALRRTNQRQLAEDISQNILCALAQKASSLAKTPERLPAWLHRATLYESSKAMRAESSHQRRQLLQAPATSAPDTSPWSEAIPHLDAVLDQLPAADRRVVLLHFFENHSFPGIARTLGKSTVAVQKQSQRALEKLARLLRAKGVTLTATVLATGLSSEFAKAAPLSLVQSATAAVLTGTATYSTTGLTLMFAAKSKALIPLVLLLCALPLALQQVAISNARSRIAQLRAEHLPTLASNSNATTATRKSSPNNLEVWKILARKIALLNAGEMRDKRTELELRERLAAMSPSEILTIMDAIATWDLPGGEQLNVAMLEAVTLKDPQMAVKHFGNQIVQAKDTMHFQFVKAFTLWMQSDSAGATAWFDTMLSSGKLESGGLGCRDNEGCHNQMMADLAGVVIADLLSSAPELAMERFKTLAQDQQRNITNSYGFSKLASGSAAALVNLVRQAAPDAQLQRRISDQHGRYADLARTMVKEGGLAKVGSFLDALGATLEERRIFAEFAATGGLSRLKRESGHLDRAAVDVLRAWLAQQAPQDVDRFTGEALAHNTPPDGTFKITAPIVEALHEATGNDDVLVAFLENLSGGRSAPERASLVAMINDETKREACLLKLKPYLPQPAGANPATPSDP